MSKYDKRVIIHTKSKEEAEKILDQLYDHMEKHKKLTYADYICMLNLGEPTHMDQKYGWFNLEELFISYIDGDYILRFELPYLLDGNIMDQILKNRIIGITNSLNTQQGISNRLMVKNKDKREEDLANQLRMAQTLIYDLEDIINRFEQEV